MRIQFRFTPLSQDEEQFHAMVLLDEVDVQAWFAIRFSILMDDEIFVALQ